MMFPLLLVSVIPLLAFAPSSHHRAQHDLRQIPEAGVGGAVQCEDLVGLTGYEFSVDIATVVGATEVLPEHCLVIGQILPRVGFEVRLPTAWNGGFVMVGNGGYAGSISRSGMAPRLREGFAVAGTDTGHSSATEPLASFATDRQKLIDYAHRAVHVTAMTAKAVIEAHYGRPPGPSYFDGCSTGGRQALISAQRFPGDFDGIVAGAPILDFTGTMMSYVWMAKAVGPSRYDLRLLADRVYAVCDGQDGLVDGVIDDPRTCDFDPSRDLPVCGTPDVPEPCYTPEQIEAFRTVYADVAVDGERLFPGMPLGAEAFVETSRGAVSGWERWVVNPLPDQSTIGVAFAESFLRYMAFPPPDPEYDWQAFDFREDPARMALIRAGLNATDADLTEFRDRGGKLLMFFGWADPALNPLMGVEYYEAVRRTMGESVSDFFRLFMVPGMFHCAGGVGVNAVDWFGSLSSWVEDGTAPDRIEGSRLVNREAVRTRPLCPYPQVAVYRGTGSVDDAASFQCGPEGG